MRKRGERKRRKEKKRDVGCDLLAFSFSPLTVRSYFASALSSLPRSLLLPEIILLLAQETTQLITSFFPAQHCNQLNYFIRERKALKKKYGTDSCDIIFSSWSQILKQLKRESSTGFEEIKKNKSTIDTGRKWSETFSTLIQALKQPWPLVESRPIQNHSKIPKYLVNQINHGHRHPTGR